MKNRFVRWAIYFAIGIVIGIGVSFYQKQQKMDEGVVELSPDDMQEESVSIPTRDEALAIGHEALKEAEEALESVKDAVMESAEEMMPAVESRDKEEMMEDAANVVHEVEEAVKVPPALTPMPE